MADEEKKEEPKIIIDEDWKHQAQKEKEKTAKQEKKEKGKEKQEFGPLPKGDFSTLVSMLVSQTLFTLGLLHHKDEQPQVNLELARFNIDMLEALLEKTKGNLIEEERQMLESSLDELRMAYVKIAGI